MVKGILKSYTVVQMKHLSYKSGCGTHIQSFYKHARFQVSVQINEVLMYNKSKQTNKNFKF